MIPMDMVKELAEQRVAELHRAAGRSPSRRPRRRSGARSGRIVFRHQVAAHVRLLVKSAARMLVSPQP